MATELRPSSGDRSSEINAAIRTLARSGGGVLRLTKGRYDLAGPIAVHDCDGITLKGEGQSTVIDMGNYCGPAITVGLSAPGFPLAMRPASPLRTSGAKASVATLGRAALGVTGHPLQFGHLGPGGFPDYWAGGGAFTFDLAVTFPTPPARQAPAVGFTEAGASLPWGDPRPWVIRYVDGALVLDVRCVGDGAHHRLAVPLRPGVNRVTWQVDLTTGRAQAWADGVLVARGWAPDPSQPQAAAPTAMEAHDGVTALMFGYSGPRMDGNVGSITDVTVHGFRAVRAPVYQWDNPVQTFASNPSFPLSDENRYFNAALELIGAGTLIGLLPCDPEPAGIPTVAVWSYRGKGAASWLPPNVPWTTSRIAIQDLHVSGGLQPCILAGRLSGLSLRRLVCDGGSQSFGTMPLMVSYPIAFEDCEFSGWDAPVVSYWQIITSRNLVMPGTGRDGVRSVGGECLWDGVKVWRVPPNSETVFKLTGQGDGIAHEVRWCLVDNEEGNAPSRAFVEMEQGNGQRGRLVVAGLNVAALAPGSAMIRLIGHGTGGGYNPYHVEASGLICSGDVPVGLRVDGDPAWHGDVNLSMTSPGAVVGSAAALAEVRVTPPTPLHRTRPDPPTP